MFFLAQIRKNTQTQIHTQPTYTKKEKHKDIFISEFYGGRAFSFKLPFHLVVFNSSWISGEPFCIINFR